MVTQFIETSKNTELTPILGMVNVSKWILLMVFSLLLSCQKKEMPPVERISIIIGESGESFLKRNAMNGKAKVDRQPAGLNFYDYDWSSTALGKVRLEHDSYSFEIPFVYGMTGTENTDLMDEGLAKFSVRAGVTANSKVLHDEARKTTIQLLKQLKSLGWKRFIYYQDPRLTGKEAYKYHLEDDTYSLPLDYPLTLDDWMGLDQGCWYLYAGDIFLKIIMYRDKNLMNMHQEGAYLLTFTFISTLEQGKSEFEGEDKHKWKEFWVEKIKVFKKERYQIEDRLRKQGFTIDEKYEEPKIHPADPVEP